MSSVQSIESEVVYKAVEGFPGYRVGDDGSVWSRWKRVGSRIKSAGTSFVIGESWKRLVTCVQSSGHCRVTLYPGRKRRLIHHLVLEAFVGPCPIGMEACHFPDRSPGNNRLSNLRWDTHTGNAADALAHGTRACGERQGASKLTSETVLSIRSEYASGLFTQKQLARKHGIHQTNVGYIVRRESWSHI